MKSSILAIVAPIALTIGLSACDVAPQGNFAQNPPANTGDNGATLPPQARTLELREVYNEFNLIDPNKAGTSKLYELRPKNPDYEGWKIEYEISNLGTSLNGNSVKIQERNTLRDLNNVIAAHWSSVSYYKADTGALERVSFSDSGVTGWVVQEGTLPASIPLDGGQKSGVLHRIDYSDGSRSTGTWQWLGKSEGYYILYVTHQESYGNEGREVITSITTFKYYITSDGYIPFFDLRVVVPDQDVDITFKATQSTVRTLPASETTESDVNEDPVDS